MNKIAVILMYLGDFEAPVLPLYSTYVSLVQSRTRESDTHFLRNMKSAAIWGVLLH